MSVDDFESHRANFAKVTYQTRFNLIEEEPILFTYSYFFFPTVHYVYVFLGEVKNLSSFLLIILV